LVVVVGGFDRVDVLTVDELRGAVARRSYKAGWELAVLADPFGGPVFLVVIKVEHAYRPGELISVRISSPMPPIPDESHLDQWVMWRLSQIELHEARESYRCDGRVVFQPGDDQD
jgi:hypothetical protein